jgi:hypothetical protein
VSTTVNGCATAKAWTAATTYMCRSASTTAAAHTTTTTTTTAAAVMTLRVSASREDERQRRCDYELTHSRFLSL